MGSSLRSLIAGVPDQPLTSSCCGCTSPLFSNALWWVGAVATGAHGRWEQLCPGGWECKRPAVGAGPSGPAPFCQPSLSSVLGWAWTARGRPALLVPGPGLSPAGHYANDFSTGLGAKGAQGHQAGRDPGVYLAPLRTASEGWWMFHCSWPFVLVWAKRGTESSTPGRVLAHGLLGRQEGGDRKERQRKHWSHAEGAREKAHGLRRPEGNTQPPGQRRAGPHTTWWGSWLCVPSPIPS